MEIIKLFLASLLSVGALFAIAKLMGHKQVAQLDFFDYICGITIGSIAAELATELEEPWKPLLALMVYGLVSVILTLLTSKLPKSRKYINGSPTIIMNDGKLYRTNLKKSKLDLSEFLLLCREQGYFDLNEIQTAIFEHNGKLSILPKAANRPITPKDMNKTVAKAHIGTEIIMDGRVMGENLQRIGHDGNWLTKQLTENGYRSESDVLLGIYHPENKTCSFYPMENEI